MGQVSNSQGDARGVGVVELEEVPDLLSAGADKTTLSRCEKVLMPKEERSYVVTSESQGIELRTNDRNRPPVVIRQEYVSPKDSWSKDSDEPSGLRQHLDVWRYGEQ